MTETKARAVEGLPLAHHPGAEVKSAMAGFLNAFNGFQDEVKQTLQQQEERLDVYKRQVYGHLLLSGNAYVEAVTGLAKLPGELHVLRSDRMAVVPGADGWPIAYDLSLIHI